MPPRRPSRGATAGAGVVDPAGQRCLLQRIDGQQLGALRRVVRLLQRRERQQRVRHVPPADYAHPSSGTFTSPPGTGTTATGTYYAPTLTNNAAQTSEVVTQATNAQTVSVTSRSGNVETIAHGSTIFAGDNDPDVTAVIDTAGRGLHPDVRRDRL